jgi:hypothetical protein
MSKEFSFNPKLEKAEEEKAYERFADSLKAETTADLERMREAYIGKKDDNSQRLLELIDAVLKSRE